MRNDIFISGLVALAYTLAGWVSLQFAVPPGYSAPFFPSAGIALAALLIFGRRHVAGVIAGSLAVQLIAATNSGQPVNALPLAVLLVPLFAGAQALAGVWLVRRLVGMPNSLDTPAPILRLMVLAAPLGCLVSASGAIPLLVHGGLIAPGEALFNWWNWWVGDTLGVVVVTPLMFVFFGHPAEDWRPRRLSVALPLCAAILLTCGALYQVSRWESQRIQTQFNRDTEHLTSLVRKRLDAQIDMTLAVRHFMGISPAASRQDFRDFVVPMLERYPGTQNFGWSPLIPDHRRAAFEAAVRRAHSDDFAILDRDPGGLTFPARPADEYLPITFVEPFASNTTVYGLNPLSLRATAFAIERSRLSGMPVASEGIRLVQERATQRGVVLYQAVFDRPPDDREPTMIGVISAVFRMDDTFAAILSASREVQVELCLVDLAGAADNRRLYGPEGCEADGWLRATVSRAIPLGFAEREWQIRLRGTAAYVKELRGWAAWTTMALGLATLGMLGAFLLITSGHTRRISRLVERRTAELARATDALREQRAALERAQRIAKLGSWECAADGGALACSDRLGRLLAPGRHENPRTLAELVGTVVDEDAPALREGIDAALAQAGAQALDCRLKDDPGRTVHVQIEADWRDGRPVRLRGTVQDVTAARQAEAHIQYLAHYDALTGLPNRTQWLERAHASLHAARRHQDRLAVLFLDLDQFKTVNDSLGHPVGDLLLATVAHRLSACMREEDVLARLGGDEFVALLPRLAHPEDAASVARKMLAKLSDVVEIDGHELQPSVSIGIALYPDDGADVDTLLKHADTAMYGAKEAGRNNYQFFVAEMNARAFQRLMLESALRRAIERHELSLHYQPQLRASDGCLTGCEALVRWQHPELGPIMPGQFIPVAEDSGLIVALGDWVLREACRQQVAWTQAGHARLLVAVNISALQFRRADFAERVAAILAETGADPACIELEITESALMQPSDALRERLLALGAQGLTLALDDFGTGYSSLAYLKRLPISRLKIDRSFVKDLPGDLEDAAVASATLSLARDLGLEVVAEGVENTEQHVWLRARGCTTMQGFLFAPPLPVEDFERWIAGHDPAALAGRVA